MRYIEVSIDTLAELIDQRCEVLAGLGAEGFVFVRLDAVTHPVTFLLE